MQMTRANSKNSGDFLPVKVFPFPFCKAYRRQEISSSKLLKKTQLPKATSLREFKPEYFNPKLFRPSSSSSSNKQKAGWLKFTNISPSNRSSELDKSKRPISAVFSPQIADRKRRSTDKIFSRYCPSTSHPLNFYGSDRKNPKCSIREGLKDLLNMKEDSETFSKIIGQNSVMKHSLSLEDKKPKIIVQAWVPQTVAYSASSLI